jgi:hypothetical protein
MEKDFKEFMAENKLLKIVPVFCVAAQAGGDRLCL